MMKWTSCGEQDRKTKLDENDIVRCEFDDDTALEIRLGTGEGDGIFVTVPRGSLLIEPDGADRVWIRVR